MSNRALFYYGELHSAEDMRASESDFGIMPMPKFDEKQEQYYTHNRSGYSLYAIANPARYRARSLPIAGALLKEADRGEEQMTLL